MTVANYDLVNKSQPWILRSTYPQTETGLLWTGPTSKIPTHGGFEVIDFQLHNRSAGAATVGLGGRLMNHLWIAGQWDDSEAATVAFTDDTTDAQDDGTSDFALETTTNNDGFVIASRVPFNWVAMQVGTAGVDGAGTTDRVVRYSNAAGSSWTDITAGTSPFVDTFSSTNTIWAAGANQFVWNPPADWGRIQAGGLSGIPGGYYALNIRTTDAPDTTAALATTIEIGLMPFIIEGLSDNSVYSGAPSDGWLVNCNGLVALFSTANAGNSITAKIRAR